MKKGDSGKCFLVNSTKFLVTPFLKNPLDGGFCINTFHVFRSSKKVFLEILQNSQENSCVSRLWEFLCQNKRLWHRRFRVNFVKFLRTPSLQNTSERRLLCFQKWCQTYFPAEYFFGLIWRLGTRVSSIF